MADTLITSPRTEAEWLFSEANGHRSRDSIVLAMGENLTSGTVLGQITIGGEYVVLAPGASDGSEVAAGVLLYDTDATAAAMSCAAILRDAEIIGALAPSGVPIITWGTADAGEIAAATAELRALGIIVRN